MLVGWENGSEGEKGWPCYAFTLDELVTDPAYVAERLGLGGADKRRFVAGWTQGVVPFLKRTKLQAVEQAV